MRKFQNQIICGDCIELLGKVKEPFADLVFADPPFNIGYQYDHYQDKLKKGKYLHWTRDWMAACVNVLKPTGSFYLAIGDDYAAHVRLTLNYTRISALRRFLKRCWCFKVSDTFVCAHAETTAAFVLYFIRRTNAA